MTMRTPRILSLAALAGFAGLVALSTPAHALRVVTWNLTLFPNSNGSGREPSFRTVMANIDADVLMVQELFSQAGRDSFLDNVLNVAEPGQWTGTNYFQLATDLEGGAIFWKRATIDTVSFVSLLVTGGPRDVLFGRVVPKGYVNIAGTFRVYSVHFKAGGPATSDSTTRRLEATSLRNQLNNIPANTNFLVGGDTNIYGAYEGAYIRLTESEADNDGRGFDPLSMPGTWHVIPGYAPYLTQAPCSSGCPTDFTGGGLDDRFDLLLSSASMNNGQGVDVVPGGYFAYGNDGLHFNTDVNGGGFNTAVGLTVANALWSASDHLPVVRTVQVASRLSVATGLDFGSVITGAVAQQTLTVTNGASAPADGLDYSLAAPAGFTAPSGGFTAAAGTGNGHTLAMSTAAVGGKSGNLVVTSDDPDNLTKNVALTGTVLAHAQPSLDSTTVSVEDSLGFGQQPASEFADQDVRVFDAAYTPLEARLSVAGATITGGAGRFSIVGGFSPALIAGVGRTWSVHFNSIGARADSTYEATLVFNTADEPLPGAAPRSDLTLHLTATLLGASSGVGPAGTPTRLAFLPPRPNPFSGETAFAFDLPRAAHAALEIFDPSGRRVARPVDADLAAGRHELRWSARDTQGQRLEAGLYFARFRVGDFSQTRRIAILP